MNRFAVSMYFFLFLTLVLGVWALPTGRFVLVLDNPKAPAGEMMAIIGNAGGAFVAPGRFPWMAVAYSEVADFPARLMKAGALLVLNHDLAVGCREGRS